MIFAALFLAAQSPADDVLFERVKRAKLEWGTCMDVYGMAAAMTQPDLTATDAAGAALGHCAPQEQEFQTAVTAYLRYRTSAIDDVMSSERTRMREVTMAAVVGYRMKHPRKSK